MKILLTFILLTQLAFAQEDLIDFGEDDLNIGGDIFSDFNEDLDAARIAEDERFYRYGRFFSINVSLGTTTFDGNRGSVTDDNHPSYGIGVLYFSDFQTAYGMGVEYSQHRMNFPNEIAYTSPDADGNETGGPGEVQVNMLRVYFSGRHYIDTADLGTALTYSNPYFILRIEYWYNTNKFIDPGAADVPADSGGGLGLGLGFGLEFPVKLKESYIGAEFLYHNVNFHDKNKQNYKATEANGYGVDDLTGNVWTMMVSYVINW